MRNYYDILGINRLDASESVIEQVTSVLSEHIQAEETDLAPVLCDEERHQHYRRVHLQYDAIAAALTNPALLNSDKQFNDTHQWSKRVVEFQPEQNTIELS